MQQWFNLSDPAVEEALYDSMVMRDFVGIDLGKQQDPTAVAVVERPDAHPVYGTRPDTALRVVGLERVPLADMTYWFFNMDDPVVGGYTPDKVALRRALSLVYDAGEEVRLPRRVQAVAAQGAQ